jgi:predicted lipoprotein with Yx(FWY)xxD motif
MARRLQILLTVLALAATACAGGADETAVGDGGTAASPAAVAPADDASTVAPPSVDGPARITTVGDDELGDLLADAGDHTLYVFFEDRPDRSTCTGTCADNWPPVLTDGAPEAAGEVDAALLGSTERDDGSVQVTYDGQPVYRYRGDAGPGEVNGFGVGDVWYPVAPDGSPLDFVAEREVDDGY